MMVTLEKRQGDRYMFMQGNRYKGRTIRKLMGGAGEVKKKIHARENLIKKILARQLTLRNMHARAWKKFIQEIW